MKIFHCDHCQFPIFFENHQCTKCGHKLAYLPDIEAVASLDPASDDLWTSPSKRSEGRKYRLCANYRNADICNWALTADAPETFCASCRLTRVIPDLSVPGNEKAWYKLEVAKRRLVYTLMGLHLPIRSKADDPKEGLAFEFLADAAEKAMTGHEDGVVTLAIAEADDAEREKRRTQLHEPVRTLLGHFRHEVGHYYWDRLIDRTHRLPDYRGLFGDERRDYGEALKTHYNQGPPANWQENFVSAYASSHPWEDWAETWSHYLQMADALETAQACGLSLKPQRRDEPTLKSVAANADSFDLMTEEWFPLTYALNNMSRGLGNPDSYPFVLSPPVIEKLRFIHETIAMEH